VKGAAVHVEHDRQRALALGRPIDVESVARVAGPLILDVPDHLYTMLGGVRAWVKAAESSDGPKETLANRGIRQVLQPLARPLNTRQV
jgi:hypothetical protein